MLVFNKQKLKGKQRADQLLALSFAKAPSYHPTMRLGWMWVVGYWGGRKGR